MLKDHKLLISTGAVLATGLVATTTLLSDDPTSPCLDHPAVARTVCAIQPLHMTHGPERGDPEPLQAHRSPMVTASSTVVQLSARSMAMATGRAVLTLSSVA